METIYSHPWLTSFFIFQLGFWVTVAFSQVKLSKD
ncbi:hypothetical protein SAMN05421832_11662 [Psychrobacillus psychrodurans]|nr:hypothetical protein SAMN05421832_11662 [Psychrobacillus psychrodurans]